MLTSLLVEKQQINSSSVQYKATLNYILSANILILHLIKLISECCKNLVDVTVWQW